MVKFMTLAYVGVVVFAVVGGLKGSPARSGAATAPSRVDTPIPAPKPVIPAPDLATGPARAAWATPDVDKLPDDAWGKAVRHGRDLIVRTYALIGPETADPSHRFSGTNMACQNCHLEAGTKQFGLPFQGVYADFPNYRARSGTVGTIEDRIQGCMTRSMNGRPLPAEGADMTAMVAYMKFLSSGRPVGEPTPGRGAGAMPEMTRPADPVRGQAVYAQTCAACHGPDGQGKRARQVGDGLGYTFPPLWGDDSFNDGAGMDRLIAAANFIRSNMPNGVTWQAPVVAEQDAWDVAAFLQSQPRSHKANLDRDYPVRLEKPADSGYGPYVDGFSAEQHRFGPFNEIRAGIKKRLKETAAGAPAVRN